MKKQNTLLVIPTIIFLISTAYAAADTAETGLIEEIVVTAQKRKESLQDVGISMTAFTGNDIQSLGFESAEDIAKHTPNLTAVNLFGNNTPNFAIRGIGLNDIAANNSSPAAIHLDEVFLPYAIMLNFGLYDTERVEVLKGPQGNLYGRNSTAGVVSYFSNRPTSKREMEFTVGYANYEKFSSEGFFNLPLNDWANLRVSGFYTDQNDGPYRNRFLNSKQGDYEKYGWRVQLNLQPTDSLNINLNVHGGGQDGGMGAYDALPHGNATLTGNCAAFDNGSLSGGEQDCFNRSLLQEPDEDPFTSSNGVEAIFDVSGLGFVSNIEWDMQFATLTSVTGFESFDREVYEDADGFPLVIIDNAFTNEASTVSQELRLASNHSGPFSWLLGAYWQTDSIDIEPVTVKAYTRNVAINTFVFQESETFAGFVNGGYQFNDKWKLSGGVRYTWEKRRFEGRTFFGILFNPPTALTTAPPPSADLSPFGVPASEKITSNIFRDLSGKLELDYTPNEDMLFYASISKGFKSGGFNGNLALNNESITEFDKEEVYAYEIGKKLTLANNTVRWNSAFFYYDYQDAQLVGNFLVQTGPVTGNFFALNNLSDAEVIGIESDIQWRPTPEFDIRFGVGWLDTKLKNKQEPVNNVSLGDELAYAPDISLNGSVSYSKEVAPGYLGTLLLSAHYQGDYFSNVANRPVEALGDYTVVDGRATLFASKQGWQADLWVKNIFDKTYTPYAITVLSIFSTLRHAGMPRTFGVNFSYAFD